MPSTDALQEPAKPTHAAVATSLASVSTVADWLRSMLSPTSTWRAVVSLTLTTTVDDSLVVATVEMIEVCTADAKSLALMLERSAVLSTTCSWTAKASGGYDGGNAGGGGDG